MAATVDPFSHLKGFTMDSNDTQTVVLEESDLQRSDPIATALRQGIPQCCDSQLASLANSFRCASGEFLEAFTKEQFGKSFGTMGKLVIREQLAESMAIMAVRYVKRVEESELTSD